MQNYSKLIQTISARICHDFAGPIGAVNNCIDMLDHKESWVKDQAKDIVTEEAKNLISNIRTFRFIFGYHNDDTLLSAEDIEQYYSYLSQGNEDKINIKIDQNLQNVNIQLIKGLFCLIKIELDRLRGDDEQIQLSISNEKAIIRINSTIQEKHPLTEMLQNPDAQHSINARNCREHYLLLLCKENNFTIKFTADKKFREYSLI